MLSQCQRVHENEMNEEEKVTDNAGKCFVERYREISKF